MTYFSNDNTSSSLPLLASENEISVAPQEQQERQDEESKNGVYVVDIILSFALPVLLRSQFWLSAPLSAEDEAAATVFNSLPVNSAIVCFFLASLLYRKSLEDRRSGGDSESCPWLCATLLPELFTLATILLLCNNAPLSSFLCMGLGSAAMSLVVIYSSITALLSEFSRSTLISLSMTIALPCLVYTEYLIAFSNKVTDMQGLQPPVACAAAVLFLCASLMYRKVLDDHHGNRGTEACLALHLLPEAFAVLTILLTSVGEVAAGFFCLLAGECMLAVIGASYCVLSLVEARRGLQQTVAMEDDTPVVEPAPYTAMIV